MLVSSVAWVVSIDNSGPSYDFQWSLNNVYLIRMCVCSTSREPEVLVLFLKCL